MKKVENVKSNNIGHKSFLIITKFIPHISAFLYMLYTLLQFADIDTFILGYVIDYSILPWLYVYLASFVFKYCYVHRLPLYYILINEILTTSDYYLNIPINDLNLLLIHLSLIGFLIFGYSYYYIKFKNSMRDFRKFCRPNTTKYLQSGDVQIKLKCGEIVFVKAKEYKKIKKFFKIQSIVGEATNRAGNIKVYDSELDKEIIISPQTYNQNINKYELIEIVGDQKNPQDGDIILTNNTINSNLILTFNDWLTVDDSWELIGLFGITTYEEEDASDGDYIIIANGHTLIIKPEDYSKVNNNWEHIDTISKYVDLGLPSGTKWAARDIDLTKPGGFCETPFTYEKSFFSWGNIDGHNPSSVSAFDYDWGGVNAQEPWYDGQPYGSTPGNTLTGNIAVGEDFDAARANLGTPWRMPTSAEFAELFANIRYINADGTEVDTTKTDKRVNVNGVMGLYLESIINGARLFFSCSGSGNGRSWYDRGSNGYYWSSTWNSARYARRLSFGSGGVYPQYDYKRCSGFALRPVQ